MKKIQLLMSLPVLVFMISCSELTPNPTISDVYQHVNQVTKENVNKIQYKSQNLTTGPGIYQYSYVLNQTDINYFVDYLSTEVIKVKPLLTPGASTTKITYYLNDGYEQSLSINGMNIVVDTDMYVVSKMPSYQPVQEDIIYHFNEIGSGSYVAKKLIDQTEVVVDYLFNLEFKLDDSNLENQEIIYTINDYSSDIISIYDKDHFKFRNTYYRVISDTDFSNLFNEEY